MERRYEGFLSDNGLYILDTHTGEVRFVSHRDLSSKSNRITPTEGSGSLIRSVLNSDRKHTDFEYEVATSYPYVIARPFSDLLKEKDPRLKCKLMVDTFTSVLKYMALQLASEYIRAEGVKDPNVHQTFTKDLTRPLISSWNLLISRILPVLFDNRVPLFSPGIRTAYEKLETHCKEPFLVTQTYSDDDGVTRTRTKKLGKIQALINYRNGLAHGFNQSRSRAEKEFDLYYPLLCDILQEVRYVAKYTLWNVESSREGVNGIRLMGASPSMEKVDFRREGIDPSVSPLFLIDDASGDILPLYAFFDVDEAAETGLPELGKDVFVFEGNTRNTLIYLSSNGEHLEKSSRYRHWKELLARKKIDVDWVDERNLSMELLRTIGINASANGIQALVSSGKYLREASIPRKEADEQIDSFISSTFNGFVLGGESGIGKSTLLAQKTEEWLSLGHMVMFYRASALTQTDITGKFLRDGAIKVTYLEDFLSLASPLFEKSGKRCFVIVDALNEYPGDLNALIKSIEVMVAQAGNHPWFKVIVSIRDSVYSRSMARFGEQAPDRYFTVEEDRVGEKIRTNIIRLQPLGKGHLEKLYNAYRDYRWIDPASGDTEGYFRFRPVTEFHELEPDGSTMHLLQNPLMARLILQSFHRSRLPGNLKSDEAMRLYLDNIVLEKTEDNIGYPERRKLLSLLVAELDKRGVDRLDRDDLMESPLIRHYVMNNQKDGAYIQLLDLGVIMEEWEGETCHVRFSFDKFLEFLLAEWHWPRINGTEELLGLCIRGTAFKILQGAIEAIAIRLCQKGQSRLLVELIDKVEGQPLEVRSSLRDMAARILFDLAVEHRSLFREIVEGLPEKPCRLDLEILRVLLNRLFTSGYLDDFAFTADIAIKEAGQLDEKVYLSDFLLSSAKYEDLKGQTDKALQIIDDAIGWIREIGDEKGYARVLRMKGAYLFNRGELKSAESLYRESLEIARSINHIESISAAYSRLGNLFSHMGKIEEAEVYYQQSLESYRISDDRDGIATCLNNLGNHYMNQGITDQAERFHQESLDIKRKLGDRRGISSSLNNLGIIALNKGEFKEAKRLQLESYEIKKKFNDRGGLGSSMTNLGVIEWELGNMESAKIYFLQAIGIHKEIKRNRRIVGCIHRVFSMLDAGERRELMSTAESSKSNEYVVKEHCWLLNMRLIQSCLDSPNIEIGDIRVLTDEIIRLAGESKLRDIDDLPVEAFYIAAMKCKDKGESEFALFLARKALEWIGNRTTRRKPELSVLAGETPL